MCALQTRARGCVCLNLNARAHRTCRARNQRDAGVGFDVDVFQNARGYLGVSQCFFSVCSVAALVYCSKHVSKMSLRNS